MTLKITTIIALPIFALSFASMWSSFNALSGQNPLTMLEEEASPTFGDTAALQLSERKGEV